MRKVMFAVLTVVLGLAGPARANHCPGCEYVPTYCGYGGVDPHYRYCYSPYTYWTPKVFFYPFEKCEGGPHFRYQPYYYAQQNAKPAPALAAPAGPAQPATVVVLVPADARLQANGQALKTASARRVFNTPALEQGLTYTYDLTMEVVRDGRPQTVTKTVEVRAGQETLVSFESPVVKK